jgi:predicted MFS family arabinose efflux permease
MKINDTEILKFYLITFFENINFILPIWVLYGLNYLNISYSLAITLGLTSIIASTVFEVPTGFISDKLLGRKTNFIIGQSIYVVTLILFLLTQNVPMLFLLMILQGVGIAMSSGTLSSLSFEYLKSCGKEKDYLKFTTNDTSILFAARIIGSLSGGLLFMVNMQLPYLMVVISCTMSIFIALSLKENWKKDDSPNLHQNLRQITKIITRASLIFYFIVVFCLGIIAQPIFFSYQPFFEYISLQPSVIGVIFTAISALSLLGSQLAKKIITATNSMSILVVMLSYSLIFSLLFLTGNLTLIFVGMIFFSMMSGMITPATNQYLQPKLNNEYRNTILSLDSVIDSLNLFAGGVLVGVILDNYGFNAMYQTLAILAGTFLMLIGVIYLSIRKQLTIEVQPT